MGEPAPAWERSFLEDILALCLHSRRAAPRQHGCHRRPDSDLPHRAAPSADQRGTYHLRVVVAVGNVALLEERAQGGLRTNTGHGGVSEAWPPRPRRHRLRLRRRRGPRAPRAPPFPPPPRPRPPRAPRTASAPPAAAAAPGRPRSPRPARTG